MFAISNLRHDLASGKEALKLKGVGKSMAAKIDELLRTGTVAQYSHVLPPSRDANEVLAPIAMVTIAAPPPPPKPALSPDAEAALLRQAASPSARTAKRNRAPATKPQKVSIKPEKAVLKPKKVSIEAEKASLVFPAVTSSFVEAEYGAALAGYEAQDEGDPTKWWPVTLYVHAKDGNVVLWYFEEDSYEGLGGSYTYTKGTPITL